MKEQWREYKEFLEQIIPNKIGKHLWHKHFEKTMAIFVLIGLVYFVLFIVFGRELFQKAGEMINAF